MFGMEMLMQSLGITPEKIQEAVKTFEEIKATAVKFDLALTALNKKVDAEIQRAEDRHKELLSAIREGRPLN